MAISKKVRVEVYKKLDGHCGYCGKEIAFKDMQMCLDKINYSLLSL